MQAKQADEPGVGADRATRRRWSPWQMAMAVVVSLAALVVLALWLARKPIATDYIDRYLAARGVAARYRIDDLGFRRQRLVDVVIGDPKHPDLVADWVELTTQLDFSGAQVTGVRAGHVRIAGRLVDNRLTLGSLDRLLPATTGKRFALPKINADIADLQMRLATPQGDVALKLSGRGRIDDGFVGKLALVSPTLAFDGCVAQGVAARTDISVAKGKPTVAGSVTAANARCGGASLTGIGVDRMSVTLSSAFDRWVGGGQIALASVRHRLGSVDAVRGRIAGAGSLAAARGEIDLSSGRFATSGLIGGQMSLAGMYRIGANGLAFDGRAGARSAALSPAVVERAASLRGSADGTPVGPLLDRAAIATAAALRRFDVVADLSAISSAKTNGVRIDRVDFASASGVRAMLNGAGGTSYDWTDGALRLGGDLTLAGGGMPSLRAHLEQTAPGAPVTGTASIAPYVAGNARLMLTPVTFRAGSDGTSIVTRATLSGPVGDGRVDGLTLPITARWDGGSTTIVNTQCAPSGFDRLAVAGMVLRPARFALCPVGDALFTARGGRLGGGARVTAPRLAGMLGKAPVALAADSATVSLADSRFDIAGLGVRIGSPENETRLDMASLQGRFAGGDITGNFSGGAGQIGQVPLLISSAVGTWSSRDGKVMADGTMAVADAAEVPRFEPLTARAVTMTLADSRITATGQLAHPAKGTTVADVSITHDLTDASGHADLDVPGISFGPALQPDELTPLTKGVIANVVGTIAGSGQIRWTAQGVTSDGVFRTKDASLAAAFGPASGISGEIRFTDLLALETAPGQVATIAMINPGVAVPDGVIRYQTLSGGRVQVEDARWPFAGGLLELQPTLLDFGQPADRNLTFRLDAVDAGQFLQQFGFANLSTTGTFDGTLPMVFDATGGRIDNGRLSVRTGGGTIAYVGQISQKDLGFWGNFAFQSLKSLRYRNLDIIMNGPLAGEIITEVRFAGLGQGVGAKRNFLFDRLQKLPLEFNVRIKAPFRLLIDSTQSFYDPQRLIKRNLPKLIEEQNRLTAERARAAAAAATAPAPTPPVSPPIQAPDSKDVP